MGDDSRRQRLRLRSRLSMVGLVKKSADFRVTEHQLVHAVSDRRASSLQRGHRGLDDLDGFVAKRFSHRGFLRKVWFLT